MRLFWSSFVVIGTAAEFYALATGRETLSGFWFWLRGALPLWLALAASAGLGALLAWLLSVHWIFSGADRAGLDIVEKSFLIVGLILGTIGGVVSRRPKEEDDDV